MLIKFQVKKKTGKMDRRRRREQRTVLAMIALTCRARHGQANLCQECRALADYAARRLEACPYGAEKPTCADCPTHCYKPSMRERIREVMRYAGPRMIYRHPLLALLHLLDSLRRPRQL